MHISRNETAGYQEKEQENNHNHMAHTHTRSLSYTLVFFFLDSFVFLRRETFLHRNPPEPLPATHS